MTNKEKLADLLDEREKLTINMIIGKIKDEENQRKTWQKLIKNHREIEKLIKND
jgi:hypothetical protein